MRDIMAEGFQEIYFKDGGRAAGLEVEFTGIQAIDVSYCPGRETPSIR
ncbi:hypothetical protein [Kitasatospora sp. NBC_01246]